MIENGRFTEFIIIYQITDKKIFFYYIIIMTNIIIYIISCMLCCLTRGTNLSQALSEYLTGIEGILLGHFKIDYNTQKTVPTKIVC